MYPVSCLAQIVYYQLEPEEQTSVKNLIEIQNLHPMIVIHRFCNEQMLQHPMVMCVWIRHRDKKVFH